MFSRPEAHKETNQSFTSWILDLGPIAHLAITMYRKPYLFIAEDEYTKPILAVSTFIFAFVGARGTISLRPPPVNLVAAMQHLSATAY